MKKSIVLLVLISAIFAALASQAKATTLNSWHTNCYLNFYNSCSSPYNGWTAASVYNQSGNGATLLCYTKTSGGTLIDYKYIYDGQALNLTIWGYSRLTCQIAGNVGLAVAYMSVSN